MTIKTGTFRNTFCASVLVSLAYAFSNGTQKENAYIRQLTMQFLSEIQNEQSSQGSFPTQRSHFRLLESTACWAEKFYDWYHSEAEMHSWKSSVSRGTKIIRSPLSLNYHIHLTCIVLNHSRTFYFNIFTVSVVIIKYHRARMCNFFYHEACHI